MQREVRRREVNILRQGINLATPDLVAKESVVPARKRPIEPSPTINPIQSNEPEDNTGLAKQRKRHTAAPPGSPPNDDPQDGDGADINVIPSSSQPKSRATDHRHKKKIEKGEVIKPRQVHGKAICDSCSQPKETHGKHNKYRYCPGKNPDKSFEVWKQEHIAADQAGKAAKKAAAIPPA